MADSILEALKKITAVIDAIDLSDNYTFDNAKPGELTSVTRPIELWKELREAQKESQHVLKTTGKILERFEI